jgi:hypothetical protein
MCDSLYTTGSQQSVCAKTSHQRKDEDPSKRTLRARIDRNFGQDRAPDCGQTDMQWHRHSTEMGVSALTLDWSCKTLQNPIPRTTITSSTYNFATVSIFKQEHRREQQDHYEQELQNIDPRFTRPRHQVALRALYQQPMSTTAADDDTSVAPQHSTLFKGLIGLPSTHNTCSISHSFVQRFWLEGECRSGVRLINTGW